MADALTDSAGLPASEQTSNYAGQELGRLAQGSSANGGKDAITIPKLQDRLVTNGSQYVPDDATVKSIAKANQMTGGGTQNMAGNLAVVAIQTNGGDAAGGGAGAGVGVGSGTGGGNGTYQANGSPVNPVLVTSGADDYEAARMILSETHGNLSEMIKIAEVLRNRTMAAQNGQNKKLGTPSAPTVTGQIYTKAQFSAYNGVTGYAGGAGSNYLATKNYTGNEEDFQKALKAWHIALAGSNLSQGSTNFAANKIWGPVTSKDGSHYFQALNGGFQDPSLTPPGTMIGGVPDNSASPGQFIQNNIKQNNTAQTLQAGGHQPTVAETSVLSVYPPSTAKAWANAHKNKKSHKTVKELKEEGGEDAAGWEAFTSQFQGIVSHESLSPIEHHKAWIHSFFRPHKNVGLQKWNILDMMSGYVSGVGLDNITSFLPPEMADAISAIDNTWKNIGPDGPIAHGVQNVLANIFTPIPQNVESYQQLPNIYPSANTANTSLDNLTYQFTTALGHTVCMALHAETLLADLSSVKASDIINNLAFPGSTDPHYLFNQYQNFDIND